MLNNLDISQWNSNLDWVKIGNVEPGEYVVKFSEFENGSISLSDRGRWEYIPWGQTSGTVTQATSTVTWWDDNTEDKRHIRIPPQWSPEVVLAPRHENLIYCDYCRVKNPAEKAHCIACGAPLP